MGGLCDRGVESWRLVAVISGGVEASCAVFPTGGESWVVSQPPPPIPGVKVRKAWLAERPSEIGQIVPI